MSRIVVSAMVIAGLVALSGQIPQSTPARPAIVMFSTADAQLIAAQAKARGSLDTFWQTMARPAIGERAFSLKVALPTSGNNSEAIWVDRPSKLSNGRYSGRLVNQPEDVKGLKLGDFITFTQDQIVDWTFQRNGKIVGNETMRPSLALLSKAEADRYRAMLETP